MWIVIVDRLIHSYHRSEQAADLECAAVRRSGRARWGDTVGIAYVEYR